mmetsp:Transcript_13146/g.31110  ORF Transcript_13146/g.31110 Transcript_13146/m.31110 type:complete len:178 (+) Transcript_13146:94-627(+)
MVTLDERTDEGGECACGKTMCKDCREDRFCGGCEVTFCDDCAAACPFCDAQPFCGDCLEDHKRKCPTCERTMCEDCPECKLCDGCEETFCDDCVGVCQFCDDELLFGDCLEDHKRNCTRLTRAVGKLDKLNERLESKESEKTRLKQRLRKINQEIEDINMQKASAERWVNELRRRGF